MKNIAQDNGVHNLLIMVDREGQIAAKEERSRIKTVENHYKWVEAVKELGCHSIRVNVAGGWTPKKYKN